MPTPDINENFRIAIRKTMKQKGYTQSEVAERAGISQRAVSTYTSGERMPRYEQLPAIAHALGITISELLGLPADDAALSAKATRLAATYDRLDAHGQTLLEAVADLEFARCNIQPIAKNAFEIQRRLIKLYNTTVAAGPGNALSDEDGNYEDIPLPDDAPQDADYAVKVSGDSMEPYIDDGSVIYVKKDTEVREMKDVGVFVYDGEVRIKQWYRDYDGTVFLLSANPKRVSANVKIPPERTDELQCLGKVILERELPNPNYD